MEALFGRREVPNFQLTPAFFAGSAGSLDEDLVQLKEELAALSPMDKRTMSGPCSAQTQLMEDFMKDQITMRNTKGWFVQVLLSLISIRIEDET